MGETCVANYASMHFVPRERIKFCNKKKKKRNEKKKESFIVIGKMEFKYVTIPNIYRRK